MKNFIIKKKVRIFLEPFISKVYLVIKQIFKLAFANRTIMFVTNKKIRSITLGAFSHAFIYIFIAWVFNVFIQSLHYDKLISQKNAEINKLKSSNNYFSEEFEMVNDKLRKINQYLLTITKSTQDVNYSDPKIISPQDINEDNLSPNEKHTLNEIRDSYNNLKIIANATTSRIKKIEKAIISTGLNIKKPNFKNLNYSNNNSLNKKDESNLAMGGPDADNNEVDNALLNKKVSNSSNLNRKLEHAKFNGEIEYLIILEKLAKSLPLKVPMKNYYVSSGFGYRIDPITKLHTPHRGLDFVGSSKEKIFSPSPGKVILARWFSDYGNAIVIDHGYGVTTRYGHLASIKVKEGEKINDGQIIGIQGNSGRSTGSHLHYEVRYRNIPLDPKRFISAGNYLLINDSSNNYVDI